MTQCQQNLGLFFRDMMWCFFFFLSRGGWVDLNILCLPRGFALCDTISLVPFRCMKPNAGRPTDVLCCSLFIIALYSPLMRNNWVIWIYKPSGIWMDVFILCLFPPIWGCICPQKSPLDLMNGRKTQCWSEYSISDRYTFWDFRKNNQLHS